MGFSDRDGGLDGRMRIVVEEGEVVVGEVGEFANFGVEREAGKGTQLAAELFAGVVDVVVVEMEIAEGVDEVAGFEVAGLFMDAILTHPEKRRYRYMA